jgi:hypothetical protein
MTRCPSDLELEALLLQGDHAPAPLHAAACPRCAARLEALRRLGEEFEREVFPATLEAVLARAPAPPRHARWRALAGPAFGLAGMALAACAMVALVLKGPAPRPPAPAPGYVAQKGSALGLSVFAATATGPRALLSGEQVQAGAALRFQVRPAHRCRLWIISLDEAGQVSRLFPPGGDEGAEVPAAGAPLTVPGGAILDGRRGPERVFAVCAPSAALCYDDVDRAAREVGAGPEAVRRTTTLPGLPADALQATLLVEKVP